MGGPPKSVAKADDRTPGLRFEVVRNDTGAITKIKIHTKNEGDTSKDYHPIFASFVAQHQSEDTENLSVDITVENNVNQYVVEWVLETFREEIYSLTLTCHRTYLTDKLNWYRFPTGENSEIREFLIWTFDETTAKSYVTLPLEATSILSRMTHLRKFWNSHTVINPSVVLNAFPHLHELKDILLMVNLTSERDLKTLLRDTLVNLVVQNGLVECFLSVDQSEKRTSYLASLMDLLAGYARTPLKLYMMVDDGNDHESTPLQNELDKRDLAFKGMLRLMTANDQNNWGLSSHHLSKVTNLLFGLPE